MRVKTAAVATVAVLGLIAGCSGGSEPAQTTPDAPATSEAGQQSPAGSPSASAPTSPAAAPSTSAAQPAPGETEVTAAGGALTWTMPCASPQDEEIEGNEQDAKTYDDFHAWRCADGGNATAGVLVAELTKTPADDDAAHRALAAAIAELIETGKPTHGTFQGHPGVTQEAELNGKSVAYQGVSFENYLAFFFTVPADDLAALTDTITIG